MGGVITLIPNAAMVVIYSYILFNGNVYPCEKQPEKNTVQIILSICESIKTHRGLKKTSLTADKKILLLILMLTCFYKVWHQ